LAGANIIMAVLPLIANFSGAISLEVCVLFSGRQHPWIILRTYAKLYVFSAVES
jgi:hypothetical protein